MQAQTNISWMSTQRYPQSKRHPDFTKQTVESGGYSGSSSPFPPPHQAPPPSHGRNSGPPPGSSPPNAAAWG
ncbi:hypothetical protein BLA29_006766, partial [Euroglyphus maynei]